MVRHALLALLLSSQLLVQTDCVTLVARDPLPQGSRGEAPWPLFGSREVTPGTLIKQVPAESYSRADANNPVGKRCSPTGTPAGNYYYNIVEPTLVPFIVKPGDHPQRTDAAVVVAPGGGHDHLAFDVTGVSYAQWLNSIGVSAFVLKYRVPAAAWKETTWVAEVDGQRALSLVRSRAAEFGFNASKIGLIGSSAGGDLTIRMATSAQRSYARVDAIDDVDYKPDFMLLLYPGIAPNTFERAGSVPETFIAMAQDDPCALASNVLQYFNAMRRHGAPRSELHIYPDGKHGYGLCTLYPEWRNHQVCEWPKLAEAFLRQRNLLPSQTPSAVSLSRVDDTPDWCPPSPNTPMECVFKPGSCQGHCDAICWDKCIVH